MSEQDNVELLRRACEALDRHDIDGAIAFAHPDIEFTPLLLELEGAGPVRGHEGLRGWWRDLLGVFPDWGIEIEEPRSIGDVTVVHATSHGRGRESDARIDQAFWQVTEWRDGRVIWWHNFLGEAEALEAAEQRQRAS